MPVGPKHWSPRTPQEQIETLTTRPVSDREFTRAVKNMIEYLWDAEERDFLEGELELDKHILSSIIKADAYLRGFRK